MGQSHISRVPEGEGPGAATTGPAPPGLAGRVLRRRPQHRNCPWLPGRRPRGRANPFTTSWCGSVARGEPPEAMSPDRSTGWRRHRPRTRPYECLRAAHRWARKTSATVSVPCGRQCTTPPGPARRTGGVRCTGRAKRLRLGGVHQRPQAGRQALVTHQDMRVVIAPVLRTTAASRQARSQPRRPDAGRTSQATGLEPVRAGQRDACCARWRDCLDATSTSPSGATRVPWTVPVTTSTLVGVASSRCALLARASRRLQRQETFGCRGSPGGFVSYPETSGPHMVQHLSHESRVRRPAAPREKPSRASAETATTGVALPATPGGRNALGRPRRPRVESNHCAGWADKSSGLGDATMTSNSRAPRPRRRGGRQGGRPVPVRGRPPWPPQLPPQHAAKAPWCPATLRVRGPAGGRDRAGVQRPVRLAECCAFRSRS